MTHDHGDRDPEVEAARPVSLDPAHVIHPDLVAALGAALVRLTDDQLVTGMSRWRDLAENPMNPEPVARFFRVWCRILAAELRRRERLLKALDPDPESEGE